MEGGKELPMSIGFLPSEGDGSSAVVGDGLVGIPCHVFSTEYPFMDIWAEGVAIESLDPGTSLTVRTRNSEYRLMVVDGKRRQVFVRGGLQVPENTRACFHGSTAGGSALKSGWLGVGLRMELLIGRREISTSRVQSITIEQPHTSPKGVAAA
jgi:hypothetical protein